METRNKLVMPPSFFPKQQFLKGKKKIKITEEYSQFKFGGINFTLTKKFKFDFPNDQVSELIINIEIV